MMKNYIKQELFYSIYSKNFFLITLLLVALFGCVLFFNYSSVTDSYDNYKQTERYYTENNLNIQEDLAGTYTIESDENNEIVSNPILFYKDTLGKYIYAASPKYTLTQLIESSVLLFPIVFGILGLIFATNDFKYRTIKFKTIRMNKSTVGISKQLSIAIATLTILLTALTISYFIGCIMYSKLSNIIPVEEFTLDALPAKSTMVVKFLFAYATALIFAEIGYSLGVIFKNISVGIIAIVVYMFVLPNFGKFDFKNSIYFFQEKVFDFYGVITIQGSKDTSLLLAGSIVLIMIVILIILNMATLIKRSSFEG